jgi:hypothetical protein
MGTPIVVDDPVSKDIHAAEIGGWPDLVTSLLIEASAAKKKHHDGGVEACGGISFPPRISDFPPEVLTKASEAIMTLIHSELAKESWFPRRPQQQQQQKFKGDGVGNGWVPDLAIKAPISMTIAPLLLHLGVDLRLIHVVRDGRDIAFSKNQSPVIKFFNATFGERCWDQFMLDTLSNEEDSKNKDIFFNNNNKEYIGAFRSAFLWSEWNIQLHKWAKRTQYDADGGSKAAVKGEVIVGNDFDEDDPDEFNSLVFRSFPKFKYFLLRIEDMAKTSKTVVDVSKNAGDITSGGGDYGCSKRRASILESLVDFVGSSISTEELCCLCNEDDAFGGRSVEMFNGGHGGTTTTTTTTATDQKPTSVDNKLDGIGSWKEGFGKWRYYVGSNQRLESVLYDLTSTALRHLGYTDFDVATNHRARPDEFDHLCNSPSYSKYNDHLTCVSTLMKSTLSGLHSDTNGATNGVENQGVVGQTVNHWSSGRCDYISHFSVMKRNIKNISPPSDSSSSSSNPYPFIMAPLGYGRGEDGLNQCCDLCLKNKDKCKHFSFEFITGECWLMGPPQDFYRDSGFASGWIS